MSSQPPYPGGQPGPQQPGPSPYGPQQPGPQQPGPQQPGPSPYGPQPGGYGQQQPPQGPSGIGPDFLPPQAMPPGRGGPPPYPPSPPSGGGGGKDGAFLIVSLILAVVVVAGAAFGAWHFWLRDDDTATASDDSGDENSDDGPNNKGSNNSDEPSPPEANLTGKVTWEHNWPNSSLGTASIGSWKLDGGVIAVARPDTIIAYNIKDGSEVWKTKLPKGRSICAVSPNTAGGIGAVALSKKAPDGPSCSELMTVDVSNGKSKWTEPLPDDTASSPKIALTPKSIVIGDYDVFRISTDGGRFTEFTVGASGTNRFGCFINDFASTKDGQILLTGRCGSSSGSEKEEEKLFKLDPDTGETTWEKKIELTGDDSRAMLASADPIIVLVSGGRAGKLLNFDQSGEQLSTINQVTDHGELSFEDDSAGYVDEPTVRVAVGEENDHSMLATEDTVYARVDTGSSALSDEPAGVVAFDRKNGKVRWNAELENQPSVLFAGVDESGVVVLGRGRDGGYDEEGTPPEASHIASKDGSITSLGEGYDDLISDEFSTRRMEAYAIWTGDSVVVVDWAKDDIGGGDNRFIYALR